MHRLLSNSVFFFNDTATTDIYTLSLHDALPISGEVSFAVPVRLRATVRSKVRGGPGAAYKVLFTVEPGAGLVGYSYVERWVRVGDESGRAGWMFLSLVGRRPTEPGGR